MSENMEETKTITEKLIWGTWEELLLVSAVKRHGTKNWDSVAMEIQNRLTWPSLTPQNCKHKYHDLRKRFNGGDIEGAEEDTDDTINPWVEELRKLRVAELRKEVEQYDVSIVSLQLKVQRLREEKERSSDESSEKPVDLDGKGNIVEAEKPVSGDDSNQSFNESNSTDPKEENRDNHDKKPQINETTTVPGVSGGVAGDTDPATSVSPVQAAAAAGEGSYNGSSETIAKDSVNQTLKISEPSLKHEPGESPELWESVAESKGEGKESSDVQSSASLSKENRCRKKDVSVSSSGEEPETEEISPAINGRDGKSHPFVKILEMIKSQKYGYVFERRLDSQETSTYKSIIRQHMDLETVNKRLKAGKYSGSRSKFFRDLLLLINNAIVFYPDNSSEFAAAIELRQVVSKEMGTRTRKNSKLLETLPPPTTNAPPPASLAKPDPELPPSLLAKPKTTLPIIACRKRSSITKGNKTGEKKETVGVEEKKTSVIDRKQDNGVASLLDDQIVIKKGKRDRLGSGPRSSRTGKAPSNMNSSKPGPSGDDNNNAEITEKEKEKQSTVNTMAKRRSAANFLNRMKSPQPSSSSNSTLLDSLKNTGITTSNGKASNTDQKKGSGGRSGTKQSLTKKNTNSPTKRSVGRPPKRNASSPVTPPPPPKRGRDTNETEAAASKQPRKRAKR